MPATLLFRNHTTCFAILSAATGLMCVACKDSTQVATTGNTVAVRNRYQITAPFGEWRIEVRVNGELAFFDSGIQHKPDTHGGGILDATPFVVDGNNFVSMVARRTAASQNSSVCEITLGQTATEDSYFYSSVFGGIFQMEGYPRFKNGQYKGTIWYGEHDQPDWPDEYSAEFEFRAEVPLRWSWQDADDIEEFSEEDKAQIFDAIELLAASYGLHNPEAIKECFANPVASDITVTIPGFPPDYAEVNNEKVETVLSQPDCEVHLADRDRIAFLPGPKTVYVVVEDATHLNEPTNDLVAETGLPPVGVLLYIGAPRKKWAHSSTPPPWVGYDGLSFIRRGGKWRPLSPHWEY